MMNDFLDNLGAQQTATASPKGPLTAARKYNCENLLGATNSRFNAMPLKGPDILNEKMIEKNASKEDYYNSQSEGKEFDKNSEEKESNT